MVFEINVGGTLKSTTGCGFDNPAQDSQIITKISCCGTNSQNIVYYDSTFPII